MNQTIYNATKNRHLLRLEYHGFYRLVEPHRYGLDKNGAEKLRCWQVDGGSRSGERHGWKLLNVAEIHATTDTGTSFAGTRPHYGPSDEAIVRVFAQL